jgi:hypothetical protein
MSELVAALPSKGVPIESLDVLKLRLPTYVGMHDVRCPQCAGLKEVPHRCGCDLCKIESEPCDVCDAVGTICDFPTEETVKIIGVPFDACRLGYMLAHCPDEAACSISLVPAPKSENNCCLRIKTGTWVGILMQLTTGCEASVGAQEIVR